MSSGSVLVRLAYWLLVGSLFFSFRQILLGSVASFICSSYQWSYQLVLG